MSADVITPPAIEAFTLKPEFAVDGATFGRILVERSDVRLTAVNADIPFDAKRDSVWAYADIAPAAVMPGWWWLTTMRYGGLASAYPIPWPAECVADGLRRLRIPAAAFRVVPCEATTYNPNDPPKAKINADREARRLVYFIQPVAGGLIKIGIARNPEGRLRMLQTGCPVDLQILATMPGGQPREAELHHRFAAHRVRGEWFEPVPELLAVVAEAKPW